MTAGCPRTASDLEDAGPREHRLDLASVNAPCIRWQFDPRREVFLSVSEEAADLGFALESWLEPGFFRTLLHPEDAEKVIAACHGLSQERDHYRLLYRVLDAQGSTRWFEDLVLVNRQADGEIVLHGVFIDVTERQQAALAVLQSEAHYRSLLDGLADGIVVYDGLGQVVDSNPAAQRILHATPEQLQQFAAATQRWTPIDSDGQSLAPHELPMSVALRTKAPVRDFLCSVLRADGGRVWLKCNAEPIADEKHNLRGVVFSFTDVTELRNVQHRLEWLRRTSEMHRERLQLAVDGANLGAWDWNPLTNVAIYNENWARSLGYRLEELRSSGDEWESRIHPDDYAATRKAVDAVLEGQQEIYEATFRLQHRDGRWLWFHARGRVVARNARGQAIRMAGIQQEVTASKEREIQLQRLREQAEFASRAKSQFLANMSHEIRTPLTSILGYTELLRDDPDLFADEAERADALQTIKHAGEHLLDVINDILDLTRIESGALQVETGPCKLHQLLLEVQHLLGQHAHSKGLQYDTEIASDVPETVQADTTRLRQVLINLIGNAVKFTDQGRVRVQVYRDHAVPNGMTIIDVTDTGPGVPSEAARGIFEAFMQADNSMTRQHGGAGLGLTISSRLMQALGGSVELAESHLRKGSTFRIRLPDTIADNEPAEAKQPAASKSVAEQPLEIATLVKPAGYPHPAARAPLVARQVAPAPIARDASTGGRDSQTGKEVAQQNREQHVAEPPSELKPALPRGKTVPQLPTLQGRILLVDDGYDNQRLIGYMLTQAGAEVDFASEGEEAFEKFIAARNRSRRKYDLVITDIQMPCMNGLELAAAIRGLGDKTPIIALTAHAMEEEQHNCLSAGCSDFTSKPVSRGDFIEQCRFWIQLNRTTLSSLPGEPIAMDAPEKNPGR